MKRVRHLRRGAILATALMALVFPACEKEPQRKAVRLTQPAASERRPSERPSRVLRVGVASVLSPGVALGRYRTLVEELGETLGIPTELVQRTNYSEMNELLRRGYCMVGFFCNYAALRAQQEFGAEMLVAPQVEGSTTYRAYLIVHRDNPARSLADLEGKRVAYADPMCNAGWLYPTFCVRRLGRLPATFFSAESFTYSYQRSIRAVADGLADMAGVESPLYDALLAQSDPAALATRVLERSPPLGTPPVLVHPSVEPVLRTAIRDFFLGLHESDRGRAILSEIRVDRFVEPRPEWYAPVVEMSHEVDRR